MIDLKVGIFRIIFLFLCCIGILIGNEQTCYALTPQTPPATATPPVKDTSAPFDYENNDPSRCFNLLRQHANWTTIQLCFQEVLAYMDPSEVNKLLVKLNNCADAYNKDYNKQALVKCISVAVDQGDGLEIIVGFLDDLEHGRLTDQIRALIIAYEAAYKVPGADKITICFDIQDLLKLAPVGSDLWKYINEHYQNLCSGQSIY